MENHYEMTSIHDSIENPLLHDVVYQKESSGYNTLSNSLRPSTQTRYMALDFQAVLRDRAMRQR